MHLYALAALDCIILHHGMCFQDSACACAVSSAWNALPPPLIRDSFSSKAPLHCLRPCEACPAFSRQIQSLLRNASLVLGCCVCGRSSASVDCELHGGRDRVFVVVVSVYIAQSPEHGRYLINVCFMFV